MTTTRQLLPGIETYGRTKIVHNNFAATKRFIKTFMSFAYVSAGVIAFLCTIEVLFGNGALVHPVWHIGSYNWLPLISQLAAVSLLGSLLYSFLPIVMPKFMHATIGQLLFSAARMAGVLLRPLAQFLLGLGVPLESQRYHRTTH